MSDSNDKILLSPRSLKEKNLKPGEASLSTIVQLLKLNSSQRTHRQTYIIQELTKQIKFFQQLTQENGEFVHRVVCEKLTYEYIPANNVILK